MTLRQKYKFVRPENNTKVSFQFVADLDFVIFQRVAHLPTSINTYSTVIWEKETGHFYCIVFSLWIIEYTNMIKVQTLVSWSSLNLNKYVYSRISWEIGW